MRRWRRPRERPMFERPWAALVVVVALACAVSAAAQAYLAVIAAEHQRDIAVRNRDRAQALADYSRTRQEAGQGSRLNHVRSSQELATSEGLIHAAELAVRQAQEALGAAIFADAP